MNAFRVLCRQGELRGRNSGQLQACSPSLHSLARRYGRTRALFRAVWLQGVQRLCGYLTGPEPDLFCPAFWDVAGFPSSPGGCDPSCPVALGARAYRKENILQMLEAASCWLCRRPQLRFSITRHRGLRNILQTQLPACVWIKINLVTRMSERVPRTWLLKNPT